MGSRRIPSKQTNNAPGDYFPEAEGKQAWGYLLWILFLPLGAVLGATVAVTFFSNETPQIVVGALFGFTISCLFCTRYQHRIVRNRARRHYQKLANTDLQNADACVQAGLWVHKRANSKEEVEKGDDCFKVALRRQPKHRDAIVSLALSLSTLRKARPPRYLEAVDLLEPWLADHDDLYGEAIAAKALKELGEHRRAAAHFRRVLEIFPDTPSREEIESYLKANR